ncbi:MAG: hypothetical protein JST34_06055 [Bacteroidetes bacterium]|nr:hypothetical protein [Bacteroidota bacterium]
MSEKQINNSDKFISIIDGEPYQHQNEWEKISYEKTTAIFKILSGLTVWQAKKIIEGLNYTIETSTILR